MIQYVYEKYGRERAGMTATVNCYRSRGAIREGILVFVAAIILVAFIAFRLVAIYQPTWAPFLPPVLIALLLLADRERVE